jgi:hypothetical protein
MQPLEIKENISKSNKLQLHHYFNTLVSVFRFNKTNTQFMGYQAVSESLQWLRKKLSGTVITPHINLQIVDKMDNPQPSSCRRYDETMEKVQRLNGFGS